MVQKIKDEPNDKDKKKIITNRGFKFPALEHQRVHFIGAVAWLRQSLTIPDLGGDYAGRKRSREGRRRCEKS
jgi:hypothetical protein